MIRRTSLALAVAAALAGAAPAAAAEITATTRLDVVANDGRCSLREAVTAADFNAASGAAAGECPAGHVVGTDVILLGPGRYSLSRAGAKENGNATGDLDFQISSVDVRGAGRDRTTISAERLDRVIDVRLILPQAALTLTGLTIADGAAPTGADGDPAEPGEAGGGIRTGVGSLVLRDSAVRGNRAGRAGNGTGNGISGAPG